MVFKVDGNLQFDSRDWSMYSSILETYYNIPEAWLLKVSSQSRKSEFRVFSIVHLNIGNL